MRIAVYAGSFDPVTFGHLQLIEDAAKLFDKLFVSIGVNPMKKTLFTIPERKELLDQSTQHIPNIEVSIFENKYLVDYCSEVGAKFYVRGLRNEDDYRFEKAIVSFNRQMNGEAQPVWLPAAVEHEHVSSSVVKGLIGPTGWEKVVSRYVPKPVLQALQCRFSKNPQSPTDTAH